ncbi:MAG: hypothetical protein ACJAW7_001109 [Candidatus Azotimanducaceae bacterium]|jgi:hypothetical protein
MPTIQAVPNAPTTPPSCAVPTTAQTTNSSPSLGRKKRTIPEELAPWPHAPVAEDLADEMAKLIKRYCILTDDEVVAIVLWIIASYSINLFRIFPKLSLISPEKRCGKSTTMEVVTAMCRDALLTSNVSAAVLYRLTEVCSPTILIDEADTFVKGGDPALVGIINSGHNQSSAQILRCEGDNFKPKAYSTWMPMVLAAIGDLPPTIMDRSIVINLRRKKSSEMVQLIPGDIDSSCVSIRRKILTWCENSAPQITINQIPPPKLGNDRAEDNWLPLFTVAGQIGGAWPQLCDSAYRANTTVTEEEIPTQLLRDIRTVFSNIQRIPSAELLVELCKDQAGPWNSCDNGKKLSPHQMAKLLRPYGIKPKMIRFGKETKRGYEATQFHDSFERYLPGP